MMFIIDWVFDKMGYTKKVHWLTFLTDYEGKVKATPKKKVATKRTPAVKKTTVRKKNV